mgnify:CR=1 FL=1
MKRAIVILLTFFSVWSYGQSKMEWLYNADKFYEAEDYPSALKYYKKVLNDSVIMAIPVLPYETTVSSQKLKNKEIKIDTSLTVSVFEYIHHQIGMCYNYTANYSHAETHFAKLADSSKFVSDQYFYGEALMHSEKYIEALAVFEELIKSGKCLSELLDGCKSNLSGCYFKQTSKLKTAVEIKMADTNVFNKGTAAFAPMWWGSEERLIFTSARDGGVILDPIIQNSAYLCDLYWTERIDADNWGLAHNFGRPLNSARHEGSGSFNNNNIMFYTRWSDEKRKEKSIYMARGIGLKFFESFKMDTAVNVPGYKSQNPQVSWDGKMLYYSSNRPGGLGGMDIWAVAIDITGKATDEPKNLGAPVNSSADEIAPFFHETSSTLFYSSNGHKSIGGLDIFKSSYDRSVEAYAQPVNMGEPVNSSKDDAYIIWDTYLKKGFLSSDRAECPNEHCYNIYEITNEPIKIMIEGLALDANTEDIIPNTTITFKDVQFNEEPFEITTDEDGFYESELKQDIVLFIKATKKSYFADAASVDTKGITETTTLIQDFFLTKIPNDEIEIKGIEYDFDSDKLRDTSLVQLDKLVEFLELNDNLVVQINSHTDARGNDEYNLDLSARRAKSCVDYLISNGIDKERLIAKGYGETNPAFLMDKSGIPILDKKGEKIQLNEDYIGSLSSKTLKKSAHQRNRRTAFKVVGEGFELESN